MTIIIKSDNKANNYISDLSGNRQTDYLLSLDFENRNYRVNGESYAFSTVIDYKRAGLAYGIKDGLLFEVEANKPLFDNPKTGSRGLWVNTGGGSIIGAGQKTNSENTVVTKTPPWNNRYMVLQVWGSGSVEVSGDIDIISKFGGVATQAKPIIFKLNSTPSVGGDGHRVITTVTGTVDHYQAVPSGYTATSTASYHEPKPQSVSAPTISLGSALLSSVGTLSEYTVIIRHEHATMNEPFETPTAVFEVKGTGSTFSAFTNASSKLGTRITTALGAEYVGADLPISDGQIVTTAIVFSGDNVTFYRDGVKIGSKYGSAGNKMVNILLAKNEVFTTPAQLFVGLFKNVVVYPYAMSELKALEASKAFNW